MCKACYDKWLKANNEGYKERQASNATKWARANPERMAQIQAKRNERIKQNWPEYQKHRRNSRLIRMYGLTQADYELMYADQEGKCAICTRTNGDKAFHVDHCHTTNKVRGLLCHQCNWYLGTLEGGDDVLPRLINYMKAHKSPAFLAWKKGGSNATT
jgi:hypothetical protein